MLANVINIILVVFFIACGFGLAIHFKILKAGVFKHKNKCQYIGLPYGEIEDEACYPPVDDELDDEYNDFDESSKKDPGIQLIIYDRHTERILKNLVLIKPTKIGRDMRNDVRVNGNKQHRFELQVGKDDKGFFVNSLKSNTNGYYFYGEDNSPNQFLCCRSLPIRENEKLTVIYGDLIYEFTDQKSSDETMQRGKEITRYEEI